MNQVSGDGELLDTARDCFRFVIKFFEPIDVSAVHIYHSALELSPLSSIVRRLYYHQRRTSFPRVLVGIPDAWDEGVHLDDDRRYHAYTWSPCGRFIAAWAQETVDIRDPLSSQLLSTFTQPQPNTVYTGQLAYSPDGHSLALLSSTSLMIWDIQTGGVTRKIKCSATYTYSLAWSFDGAMICTIVRADPGPPYYNVYNVASGTTLSSGILQSGDEVLLWAHNTSFQVISMKWGDQAFTIYTLEVGSILTKVESFHVKSLREYDIIGCFSPTAYRISISNLNSNHLRILDVWKSECLLEVSEEGKKFDHPNYHCFSSDASLFAVFLESGVHIWKYTSGRYTLWREFPPWDTFSFNCSPPQFSPTSSSIMGCCGGPLQVWCLDSPPIIGHPNGRKPLGVISDCGTYIVTGHVKNSTVSITNLLSPTPSQFIDTDMDVLALALTGNVLLVWGQELVAWRLTEKGIVDGASADRRAGRGDSIWTMSAHWSWFLVEGQNVFIQDGNGNIMYVYHTGTGDILGPAQIPPCPCSSLYNVWHIRCCHHYLHYRNLGRQSIPPEDEWPVTWPAIEEGWVKDLEGKHRMWVPGKWKEDKNHAGWLRNTTLVLYLPNTAVIVMF